MVAKKNTDRYYVDKKAFYTEMLKWRIARDEAIERGEEPPAASRYVGECLYNIVNKLSTKYNFSRYPFIDEMIADALENVVVAMPNFDPYKYTNPFAYFSTVAYFAFVRRIQGEKKRLVGKYRIAERAVIDLAGEYSKEEVDATFSSYFDNPYMQELIKNDETPREDRPKTSNTWRLRKHQEKK